MSAILSFQLTSSQGGWPLFHFICTITTYFSTHILTRRMTTIRALTVLTWIFSTHILTRRMTQRRDHYVYGRCIFNSHPHKEDDEVIWATSCDIAFSTHILTRRMTCRQFADNRYRVFQLTSSQGGWRCGGIDHGEINTFFNSHPHKEDDHCVHLLNRWEIFSTHILTRRMTSCALYSLFSFAFQLTSSQGGWQQYNQHH
mgnify:CR=1 FL=1